MVQSDLATFCHELANRAPSQTSRILKGEKQVIKKDLLKQDPEQFVNQYLVWPVCESIGYDFITERYLEGHGGSIDVYISNTTEPILCECKRLNHYKRAIRDLREYLDHRTTETNYGIATDGINWLLIREPGDQRMNVEVLEYHSFRGAIFDCLVSLGVVQAQLQGERVLWNSSVGKVANASYEKYGQLRRVPIADSVADFVDKFSVNNISAHMSSSSFDETLGSYENQSLDDSTESTLDDFI